MVKISAVLASDIYVNQDIGNDMSDGRTKTVSGNSAPFKTINQAIAKADPGDTIHIIPTGKPYYQGIEINNKHGEPNKPIIIDGHGVTLSGEGYIDPNSLRQVSTGLWRHVNPISATNTGFASRYFFIIDGKVNRMEQCSKGPCAPFLKVDELKDGQWTYIKDEDAYYIKLGAGQSIDSIKVPVLCNVVWLRGDSRYIVIKNLNTTHSWNDGFNFYDEIKNIRLENISAVECGDDGFSTHDRCEVELDGFFATANATGICNTGTGFSSSRNILLYGNNGFEYSLFGPGRHIIEDSVIYADAVQPFFLHNNNVPDGQCRLDVRNVVVINTAAEQKFLTLTVRTSMTAVNMVLSGISIKHSGDALSLADSKITGCPVPDIFIDKKSLWKASNNFYSCSSITFYGKVYAVQNFEDYRNSADDLNSKMIISNCKIIVDK